jgi:hypothetical protein
LRIKTAAGFRAGSPHKHRRQQHPPLLRLTANPLGQVMIFSFIFGKPLSMASAPGQKAVQEIHKNPINGANKTNTVPAASTWPPIA